MKILVFLHQFEIGGTVVHAIELAETLRKNYGHELVFFSAPGPMVKLAKEKGIRFLPAPKTHLHPSLTRICALRDVVQQERPDLIHAWDWWQCIDAYYAVHLPMRIPMVHTDMSMCVSHLLPKALPTTFGTPELLDLAKKAGRRPLELILPPVNVNLNAPEAVDPRLFRKRYQIEDDDITLVTVSRLNADMKGESLVRTIDVVRSLGRDLRLRFVVVGGGPLRAKIERLARETNEKLKRNAIVLTGELLDPRPAFAAADIVIGMGSSALRGMAFGKPVVIVGERGFSAPFKQKTADFFYYKGMYGLGDGSPGNAHLMADICEFAEHPDQLKRIGEFSRRFVVQHFSLETVSENLAKFFQVALVEEPRFYISAADGLRTATVLLGRRFVPDRLRNRLRHYELDKQREWKLTAS